MTSAALFERADRAIAETRHLIAGAKASRVSIEIFGMPGILIAKEPVREGRLSMARRHVKEGEGHVARQLLAIVRFDRDGPHDLAAKGQVLLRLLEQSLTLARQDLARAERDI